MQFKKTVSVDFDGVLHAYTSKWTRADQIHDGPVPGALEAVQQYLRAGYKVVVHSARAKDPRGLDAIEAWLIEHGFPDLVVVVEKPHAELYIDDRGYQFNGTFPSVEEIQSFKPWNKR